MWHVAHDKKFLMRTSDSAALRMEMIAAVVMDGQVQADATLLKQGHTDRAKI